MTNSPVILLIYDHVAKLLAEWHGRPPSIGWLVGDMTQILDEPFPRFGSPGEYSPVGSFSIRLDDGTRLDIYLDGTLLTIEQISPPLRGSKPWRVDIADPLFDLPLPLTHLAECLANAKVRTIQR